MKSTGVTEATIAQIITRIRRNHDIYAGQFPAYGTGTLDYLLTSNKDWLAAFWSGLLWLTAAHTGEQADIDRAKSLLPTFVTRLDEAIHVNHDLGFLYLLSSRAAWQLTADKDAHVLTLRAAEILLGRYRPVGEYIQAWGAMDNTHEAGRFIIDCMMNLPLLYWASRETGKSCFADVATAHARTSARYLMRDDGRSYHTYFINPDTGEPVGPKTHQGYANDSLWSRGQAWAIYGFTMAAEWTGDQALLETAKAAAARYQQEIVPGEIAPWDFALPDDAPAPPDSSADAIAAGGLLRLAAYTHDDHYRQLAAERVQTLLNNGLDTRPEAQGLLLHGTQHVPGNYGVDTYTIFGDYFFFEAILNLLNNGPDFWGPDSK